MCFLCFFVHFQRGAGVAFEFTFVTRWVKVGARRERIRGLCWQLVELLEDKFLARLPALPKLMPNILRRGKHKKLSSLNRRRGPEKIIVITPPQKVMCFSILSIYRFVLWGMLLQIFEPLSACFTFIGKFSCHSVSAMISLWIQIEISLPRKIKKKHSESALRNAVFYDTHEFISSNRWIAKSCSSFFITRASEDQSSHFGN